MLVRTLPPTRCITKNEDNEVTIYGRIFQVRENDQYLAVGQTWDGEADVWASHFPMIYKGGHWDDDKKQRNLSARFNDCEYIQRFVGALYTADQRFNEYSASEEYYLIRKGG